MEVRDYLTADKAMDPFPFTFKEIGMVKSLMWLLDSVLQDCSTRCGTATHRDKITMSRRIEYEGVSFLMITLPNFCKDFESCLADGWVDPARFPGFRKRGAIPAFLSGMLGQVFDPNDGRLLDVPSIDSIFCIRQLCLMWKKIDLPCSPKRIKETFNDYVKLEDQLNCLMSEISERDFKDFRYLSGVLWSEILGDLAKRADQSGLIPRHGPGATAERVRTNSKYNFSQWHTRLDSFFPPDTFRSTDLGVSWPGESYLDEVELVDLGTVGRKNVSEAPAETPQTPVGVRAGQLVAQHADGNEIPVRVVTVPKTLVKPRIIAIEPVCMQYTQQAVLEQLVELIESSPVTAGRVNFSDQSINRRSALDASKSGNFATIDLSDASDRVHKDLVYAMLSSVPYSRDMIFACRSRDAELPDGRLIPLSKFASMGSALCFPIESMMFFTLCILSMMRSANRRLSPRDIKQMAQRVYVYGDDLIVPTDEVPGIMVTLEAFGLKVNHRKSFWTGKFRESCGLDAYDGDVVTTTYLRREWPANAQDAQGIVSYVSFANQLYLAGFWHTAQEVRNRIEKLLRRSLPYVLDTASCLGWTSHVYDYSYESYPTSSKGEYNLQKPMVWAPVVRVGSGSDPLEGYGALMKFFLKRGNSPMSEGHLERSVRPESVNIKFRWVSPF